MEKKLILEIAERIRALREILDLTEADMAAAAGVTEEEYHAAEAGDVDFSFTFLYLCAEKLGVDLSELLTGRAPTLSFYTITRKGHGLPIERRQGFKYLHLAHLIRDRIAEPFIVTAPWHAENETAPIALSSHEGQEFDLILSGDLLVQMENHTEVLHEGDSIYYDSGHKHGMVAAGGKECVFLAVVMKSEKGENA